MCIRDSAETETASVRLALDNETRRWTPGRDCTWDSAASGWAQIDAAHGTGVLDVEGHRTDPPFAWWDGRW